MKIIKAILFIPTLTIIILFGVIDIILIVLEALFHHLNTNLTEILVKLQEIYDPPKKKYKIGNIDYCEKGEN